MGYTSMLMRKFVIYASYLNALDSDNNVTMDHYVARIGSRREKVEMFGEILLKEKMEGVFKKRLNFLNSAPTSTEDALRLLSAPSGRF